MHQNLPYAGGFGKQKDQHLEVCRYLFLGGCYAWWDTLVCLSSKCLLFIFGQKWPSLPRAKDSQWPWDTDTAAMDMAGFARRETVHRKSLSNFLVTRVLSTQRSKIFIVYLPFSHARGSDQVVFVPSRHEPNQKFALMDLYAGRIRWQTWRSAKHTPVILAHNCGNVWIAPWWRWWDGMIFKWSSCFASFQL